jgi:hypothetical protein
MIEIIWLDETIVRFIHKDQLEQHGDRTGVRDDIPDRDYWRRLQ